MVGYSCALPLFGEFSGMCSENLEDFIPAQFVRQPAKVPWKAVIYAVILLLIGTGLLIAGCLIGTTSY